MSREVLALVEAARGVRRKFDAQVAYTREMQMLAAEARRTGQNLSHRIPYAPRVNDFGDCIRELLEALEKYERKHPKPTPGTGSDR